MLQSGEWERDKFYFDQHFAFLTNFLKIYNFLLGGIFFRSYVGRIIFKKNVVQNGSSLQIL